MSYVNGKEICDGCGITKYDSSIWKRVGSQVLCPMCQQKKKLMDEQSAYVKKAFLEGKDYTKYRPYKEPIDWGNLSRICLIIMKWTLCFFWGGPYLIIKGVKNKDSLWTIIGIEFTLLIIIFSIISSLINPLSAVLEMIFGSLILLNIVSLIFGYIKYSND